MIGIGGTLLYFHSCSSLLIVVFSAIQHSPFRGFSQLLGGEFHLGELLGRARGRDLAATLGKLAPRLTDRHSKALAFALLESGEDIGGAAATGNAGPMECEGWATDATGLEGDGLATAVASVGAEVRERAAAATLHRRRLEHRVVPEHHGAVVTSAAAAAEGGRDVHEHALLVDVHEGARGLRAGAAVVLAAAVVALQGATVHLGAVDELSGLDGGVAVLIDHVVGRREH
eukprot:281625_1